MGLNKSQLEKDILKALNDADDKAVKGEGGYGVKDANADKAAGIATAIETYIKNADVETNTDTPNIKIMPGIPTAGSPAAQATTAPGNLMPQSGRGTGKGKIV